MSDDGANALTPLNRVLSPPLNLVPPNTPPNLYSSALSYFTSIPWCAELLSSPPSSSSSSSSSSPSSSSSSDGNDDDDNGGGSVAIPFIAQCFNPLSAMHDQFVGATLASHPRGLRHMLSFFRPRDEAHLRDRGRPVERVHTLYALGDGLSGYRGIVHGGMTATMLDEAMGTVNEINTALGKDGAVYQLSSVTGSLDITFVRAVPLPGVVCVTAWTECVEGRKTRMACEMKDARGRVLARSRSTWVALRSNL